MPLPITTDSLDAIPEALRSAYVERDGAFHLDAEIPKPEDVSGLRKAIAAERKTAEEQRKAAREAAERNAALERELEALRVSGGDFEKKASELLNKWNTESASKLAEREKEWTAQIAEKDGKLRKLLLTDNLRKAFIDAGGRAERLDEAIDLTSKHFDLVDDRPVMKDDKGDLSTTTPKEFFEKMFRQRLPEFYKGTQAAGGGAGGSPAGGSPTLGAKKPTEWTSDERRAYIEEHGPDAYTKLLRDQVKSSVKAA